MNFGALPPEINSGLMYSGPGSGPMLNAAAAWETLAGELRSAAASYQAVISRLTGDSWVGPSSVSMAAAAGPYIAWLEATAVQAEQTAGQARSAAGAYQTAFAATVPPPIVADNRIQLAALHATNIFGQNAAAIAATEAHYAAMWARDAAAMSHYAGTSAAATAMLTPFAPAPRTTDPAGSTTQAAGPQAGLPQPGSTTPQTLTPQTLTPQIPQAAASPLPAQGEDILEYVAIADIFAAVPAALLPANIGIGTTTFGMGLESKYLAGIIEEAIVNLPPEAVPGLANGVAPAAGTSAPAAAGAGPALSAGLGDARTVGRLSVPQGWATTAPEMRPLAMGLADTPPAAATPAAAPELESGTTALYGDIALASLAGSALAGSGPRGGVASAMNGHAPDRLEQFVAELAQKPGSQVLQHWHTDPARLDGLLAELSKKPGIHAVHLKGGKPKPPPPGPRPG